LSRFPDKPIGLHTYRINKIVLTIEGHNLTDKIYCYDAGRLDASWEKDCPVPKRALYMSEDDVVELNNPNHTPDGVLIVGCRELV